MGNPMNRDESSSSSSDEADERLKEALDPSMFDEKTAIKRDVIKKSVNNTNFKNNLDVTPEFQSYVGKHLADMLDKSIKEKRGKNVYDNGPRTGGVKLFSVSSEILTDDNFCEYSNAQVDPNLRKKRKRPKKRDDDDQMTEMEKIHAAAVSPEWILEKRGVKEWSKPKGEEIKVIENVNGELTVVVPTFVSN